MRQGRQRRKGGWARDCGICVALALVGALAAPAASSAADEVTTFQVNPAHDRFSTAVGPTAPLTLDWKRELGVRTSYPVVADGRVFVTANDDVFGYTNAADGATLYALDIETGETLWSRWVPDMSSPTYDDGRVIVSSAPTGLDDYTAVYDAATGRTLAVGTSGNRYTPVARDGRIFGPVVIDVSNGTTLWGVEAASMAAVDAASYYLADTCGKVRRIDATDGHQVWAVNTNCSGGGGNVAPVLHNGELWARNIGRDDRGVIYDTGTGAVKGEFSSVEAPAFAGNTVLVVDDDGTLRARDLSTQVDRWAFAGDLRGPPLIVGSTVYAISADAHLYALDLATGVVLWDQDHDGWFSGEFPDSDPSGLAVADGRLLAPVSGGLYAYGNTGGGLDPGSPPDPGAAADVAELPPLEPPGESIGYRGDPAHSGFINSWSPAPPVRPVWTYGDIKGWEMPRDPIQPLVTGGKLVYYDGGPEDGDEQAVHALDAHTGQPVWTYPGGGPVAVDGDSVYALGRNKVLTSLDLDTGQVNWQTTIRSEAAAFAAPQAADGVVYTYAGSRLEAHRGSDGALLWGTSFGGVTESGLPAVDADKVYVECAEAAYRATGQKVPGRPKYGCRDGTISIGGGASETGGFVQSQADGRLVDLSTDDSVRAGNLVIRWRLSQLRADRAGTGERLWGVDLPRTISSPPLIVGRYLYVPTTPLHTPGAGRLLTFDLATGVQVDELTLPGLIQSGDVDWFDGPPSMTAAEGLLFIPVGYGVIALATQGPLLDTEITSGPEAEIYETSASFEFTGSGGATGFECSLDHAAFESCRSPTTVGPLLPGDHVFEVRAIAAGQTDSTPATRDFTVLETPSTPELETEIISGPSGETADASHEFAFSASEAGATFECGLDDSDFSACTNPTTVGPLAPGPHTFQVRSVLDRRVDPTPASRVFSVASVEETDPPREPVEDPPADPIAGPPSSPVEEPPPTVLPGLGDLPAQAPPASVQKVILVSRSGSDFLLRLEVRALQPGRGDTVIVRGPDRSSEEIAARMHKGSANRWSISRHTPEGAQLIDGLVRRVSKRGSAAVRAGVVGPAGAELDRFRITGFGRAGAGAT